jgi:hypothetical protein
MKKKNAKQKAIERDRERQRDTESNRGSARGTEEKCMRVPACITSQNPLGPCLCGPCERFNTIQY